MSGLIEDPLSPGLFFPGSLLDDGSGLYAVSDDTSFLLQWRSILLGTIMAGDYFVKSIDGWEELPPFSSDSVPNAGRHGSLAAPIHFGDRTVTVAGWCRDVVSRNHLLRGLRANTSPLADTTATGWLTVTDAGLTLSAKARVVRAGMADRDGWALGRFGWSVQWLCTDPLRYGSEQTFFSPVSLPVSGLTYPVTYPVTYPANPVSGQVTLYNEGDATAPAVFTLQGPLATPGVINVSTSARQEFALSLDVGDQLVIDTAVGGAFLNGEFRSPTAASDLCVDLEVPSGSSTFQALGTPTGSGASLSVSFRPAYW
jgi:hypothetical protein